jgi:UrcA family protein
MNKKLVAALAGALATSFVAGAALAATPEIIVEVTRATKTPVEKSASGVEISNVAVSYRVSTEGLDLATTAGAQELEKRIAASAANACKELSRQYPLLTTPSDAECTKQATDKAMVKAKEMETAAAAKKK